MHRLHGEVHIPDQVALVVALHMIQIEVALVVVHLPLPHHQVDLVQLIIEEVPHLRHEVTLKEVLAVMTVAVVVLHHHLLAVTLQAAVAVLDLVAPAVVLLLVQAVVVVLLVEVVVEDKRR